MNNYIEDKDSHEVRIDSQNKTINQELQKRLKWYEAKYGPYIEKPGLKNWKNLFRKPTMMEWTVLALLILILFGGWAYNNDIQTCQKALENFPRDACEVCRQSLAMKDEMGDDPLDLLNISNIKLEIINES